MLAGIGYGNGAYGNCTFDPEDEPEVEVFPGEEEAEDIFDGMKEAVSCD